jgi:anti-repressor protein
VDKLMQVFQYNGAQVRVSTLNGEPAFVANDVCAILAVDPTQTRRLDPDEKGLCSIQTPGGEQQMLVVTESGLYTLVLGSRKPEARAFKRWVTHDVLPQIRKTGGYNMAQLPQTFPEALRLAADLAEQKMALEAKIEEDKPKVDFFEDVVDAKGNHPMNEAAKLLGWGPNNLFAYLRKMNILLEKPRNAPRQCYIDQGYFTVKERVYTDSKGQHIHCTPFVTPKGLQWMQAKIPPYVGHKKCHGSGKTGPEGHWPAAIAGPRS